MLIIASVIYYQAFKNALLERTLEQLSSINILKRIQLEEHLENKHFPDFTDPHIKFILLENTGIGRTGESYLVDKNFRMRSQSRFLEKKPEDIIVNTESVRLCFQTGESKLLTNDYRNVPVLSIGRIVEHDHIKDLAILTEIDEAEAMKPVYEVRNYIIIIVFFSSVLISLITLWMARALSNPINILKSMIEEIARGKTPSQNPGPIEFIELEEIRLALEKLKKAFIDTTYFAQETGKGNFNAHFIPLSNEDMLGASLIQMRDRLKELTAKELTLQRQRSAALLEGQEKERERISQELHDGLGQLLTGIKLMLENIPVPFDKKTEIKELLGETIQEVRRISQSAMPPALTELGLEAALNNLVQIMSAKNSLEIELDYDLEKDVPPDFESRICLYRIAQEAINNMVKYSEATRCLVQIYQTQDDNLPENTLIVMRISDNGKGFNQEARLEAGHGLRNMKERAAIINGSCIIDSREGAGTEIIVKIPLLNPEVSTYKT